jgi:hypothetical protein
MNLDHPLRAGWSLPSIKQLTRPATQNSRFDIQSIKPGVRRKVLAVSYLASRSVRKVAHCHRCAKPSARAGIPKDSLVFAQVPGTK